MKTRVYNVRKDAAEKIEMILCFSWSHLVCRNQFRSTWFLSEAKSAECPLPFGWLPYKWSMLFLFFPPRNVNR